MKKLVLSILLFTLCMGLSGCGNKNLTTGNIKEYLNISATVLDSTVNGSSKSVAGIYTKSYSGSAKVQIQVTNQSGAKFENVKIECKISKDIR